jgi:hypothetical protein
VQLIGIGFGIGAPARGFRGVAATSVIAARRAQRESGSLEALGIMNVSTLSGAGSLCSPFRFTCTSGGF